MILTDEEAINIIKANQEIPAWVKEARDYTKDCRALFNGTDFNNLLVARIEKLENEARAQARIKYARDIKDTIARISMPIQNVFTSTGGVKNYDSGETKLTDSDKQKLLGFLSNIRDGKSIERYIQNKWMKVYHTDPSGVQWLVYTSLADGGIDEIYPTYQSISTIRNYVPCGQIVEWLLFEPVEGKGDDAGSKYWTMVDDARQMYFKQSDNDTIILIDDPAKTFDHPFGSTPVVINSDITDENGCRLSPYHEAIPILKEYARDLSIKTIYKFLQGFPKHWRRVMFCAACRGSAKNGDGKSCEICSGTGRMYKSDITDDTLLPAEVFAEDQKLSGNDIMGYSSPDLDTWERFNEELELLESLAYETIWGCEPMKKSKASNPGAAKTATEIVYDKQPQINKLNQYADASEWLEWKLTEWIANAIDPAKPKDANISLIVYGRRYIMEGIDTLQQKYEAAKEAGDTIGILDAIYQELLTVKFKNDPEWMRLELAKSRVEPYLHWDIDTINNIFGAKEAGRKIYFQQWWSDLDDESLKGVDIEPKLEVKFKADFELWWKALDIKPALAIPVPTPPIITDPNPA